MVRTLLVVCICSPKHIVPFCLSFRTLPISYGPIACWIDPGLYWRAQSRFFAALILFSGKVEHIEICSRKLAVKVASRKQFQLLRDSVKEVFHLRKDWRVSIRLSKKATKGKRHKYERSSLDCLFVRPAWGATLCLRCLAVKTYFTLFRKPSRSRAQFLRSVQFSD